LWYRRAAKAGDVQGAYHLGVLLFRRGGENDAEVEELLQRAIEGGHAEASTVLAQLKQRQGGPPTAHRDVAVEGAPVRDQRVMRQWQWPLRRPEWLQGFQ
jgi:TPR repeat protein